MAKHSNTVSPTEKRRFTSAVRKALRELDYIQFQALVYWQGANDRSREVFETNIKHLLTQLAGQPRLKVALLGSAGYPLTAFGGMTLKPTYVIKIEAQNLGLVEPVGVKDGRLHISVARRRPPAFQPDTETEKAIKRYLLQLEQ